MKMTHIKTKKESFPIGVVTSDYFSIGNYILICHKAELKSGSVSGSYSIRKAENAPDFTVDIEYESNIPGRTNEFRICSTAFGSLTVEQTQKLMAAYNHAINVIETLNDELEVF
jgi:hypothetical protein